MATRYLLASYAALKALVEADATWFGVPANVKRFVWFDEDEKDPDPDRDDRPGRPKQPGKVPELKFDWSGGLPGGRQQTRTFGNAASGSCPFVGTETHDFEFVYTTDDHRITAAAGFVDNLERVLNVATLDVGVGPVARIAVGRSRATHTSSGPAAGHWRRVVRVPVTVTVTYQG